MAIVKKQVDYAQEAGDVGVALENLLRNIRAKKPLGEIVAAELQDVIKAVDGIDQVKAEEKADRAAFLRTLGYHTGGMADALLDPVAAQPVIDQPVDPAPVS